MIAFINAKINLGLNVVARREDGYHELESVFYPVGIYNGTPENPEPFCDVIEITASDSTEDEFVFSGNFVDCPIEKNLVYKAVKLFREKLSKEKQAGKSVKVTLDKHLPDGAGLGGGSADASFTLRLLNEHFGTPFDDRELKEMAKSLGADCPFFIDNKPAYVTGIGEKMETVEPFLQGSWAVIIKPDVYVSTKEAFSRITPKPGGINLKEITKIPVTEWETRGVKNDFEKGIFAGNPQMQPIKRALKEAGAEYAAMSGSGSSIFGIFPNKVAASDAFLSLKDKFRGKERIYLCKL